ncbi:hypothetical protein L6R50_11115 [Myxococcota bacterium]|nr:hypothetical protein [Myxococcota bacterium]
MSTTRNPGDGADPLMGVQGEAGAGRGARDGAATDFEDPDGRDRRPPYPPLRDAPRPSGPPSGAPPPVAPRPVVPPVAPTPAADEEAAKVTEPAPAAAAPVDVPPRSEHFRVVDVLGSQDAGENLPSPLPVRPRWGDLLAPGVARALAAAAGISAGVAALAFCPAWREVLSMTGLVRAGLLVVAVSALLAHGLVLARGWREWKRERLDAMVFLALAAAALPMLLIVGPEASPDEVVPLSDCRSPGGRLAAVAPVSPVPGALALASLALLPLHLARGRRMERAWVMGRSTYGGFVFLVAGIAALPPGAALLADRFASPLMSGGGGGAVSALDVRDGGTCRALETDEGPRVLRGLSALASGDGSLGCDLASCLAASLPLGVPLARALDPDPGDDWTQEFMVGGNLKEGERFGTSLGRAATLRGRAVAALEKLDPPSRQVFSRRAAEAAVATGVCDDPFRLPEIHLLRARAPDAACGAGLVGLKTKDLVDRALGRFHPFATPTPYRKDASGDLTDLLSPQVHHNRARSRNSTTWDTVLVRPVVPEEGPPRLERVLAARYTPPDGASRRAAELYLFFYQPHGDRDDFRALARRIDVAWSSQGISAPEFRARSECPAATDGDEVAVLTLPGGKGHLLLQRHDVSPTSVPRETVTTVRIGFRAAHPCR